MKVKRDLAIFAALVVTHELLRQVLGDGTFVSALLAPGGIRGILMAFIGIGFVATRFALFVGAPGWLVATLFVAAYERVAARRLDPASKASPRSGGGAVAKQAAGARPP